MGKSINIVFIKQKPSEREGILFIRTIEDRTPKKKSLGIKIKETDQNKYFTVKTQRFKSDKRFEQSEEFNLIIATKLKELSKNDNDLTFLPNEKSHLQNIGKNILQQLKIMGLK